MVKLTAKSEYGVLALLYLACHGSKEPVAVMTMAEDLAIPRRFLEQIVGKFRQKGLVRSLRGARGGYRLSRDPTAITMEEIFLVTEGSGLQRHRDDLDVPNMSNWSPNIWVIRDTWTTLQNSVTTLLGSITLQQMCDRAKAIQQDASGPRLELARVGQLSLIRNAPTTKEPIRS